jgi:hypothetical protein
VAKTVARNIVVAGDYAGKSVIFKSEKVMISTGYRTSEDINKETVLSYEVVTEENKKFTSDVGVFTKAAFMLDAVAGRGLAGFADNLAMLNLAGETEKLILVSIMFKYGKTSLLEIDNEIYKAIVTLCFGIKNNNSEVLSDTPKANTTIQSPIQPHINIPDELRKFKAHFDEGVITKDEFDIKKKQLLELEPSLTSFSKVANVAELDIHSVNDEQSLSIKNLYFKDLKGKGKLQIADIINITFDPKAKPEASLFVDTTSNRYQIGIWNHTGNKGDDVLHIVNKIITVLTNNC